MATYVPTYLLGVGERITEAAAGSLVAEPFNQPGEAVPVRAVFVNDGKAPLTVRATFSASRGFRPAPAEITQAAPAGATIAMAVRLVSDGTLRKGTGQVRMEAQMGLERLVRVAAFGVGESMGRLPPAPGPIVIDGKLDDWGVLATKAMPIGMIADISQCANGNKELWKGPDDLGAKIYAGWTPQALYVAVAVTDDAVLPTPPGAKDPWSYDAVEVFLDGRSFEMQWQPQPTENCYQIGVSPAKDGMPSNTRVFGKILAGLQTATSLTNKGYIVELMIPLTSANFPAGGWKAGRPIKLSVLVNDKDDPAASGRKYVFGWAASPKGENYMDTSGWQILTLSKREETQ